MTVVWLWALSGILAGALLAALLEVHSLHARLMRAWVRIDAMREQLRAERHMLIVTRDALLKKIHVISERSGEIEELAHALAQLAPLRELREESEFGRLRSEAHQ